MGFKCLRELGAYDMIIGHDLLSVLGIKFDFTDMSMEWDKVSIPMKDSNNSDEQNYYVQEPEALLDMKDQLKVILDTKYEKADLLPISQEADYLKCKRTSSPT
jgi:hypothetical protein